MACILLAAFCFATGNTLIRGLAASVPPVEVAFFRSLFALLLHLPLLWWYGIGSIRTARPRLHATRGVLHAISMVLWFVALASVPLAEATALEFAGPIMTTVIAILFLGEVVRVRRMVALAVGIAGVMLVVRPGFDAFSVGQMLCLVSVALWSACQLIIRELGRTDSAFTQGFYTVLAFTPITALIALPTWIWPDTDSLMLLFLLAIVSTVGTWFYGEAFRNAEMTAILPLEATKMIWAVGYGLFFFAEIPHILTLVGGAVIFAAAAYITIREAQIARAARA